MTDVRDTWAEADAYEPYVGRWSRLIARKFLDWLDPASGLGWIDVGCGTGALSQTILEVCAPRLLLAIDRSAGFVTATRARTRADSAGFAVADARELPAGLARFDLAVSGLVLNFVPDPGRMIAEMMRTLRPDGWVALYVWDYAERMQLMRCFWDAAVELNPAATELDEARRFPLCRPEPLRDLLSSQGLSAVEVSAIDVATVFRDFDDYWSPFLGGQGPAPGYVAALAEPDRVQLRDLIRSRLPRASDGSIALVARAWAVRGRVADDGRGGHEDRQK